MVSTGSIVRVRRLLAAGVATLALVAAGCGDDDGASDQDAFCDSADDLRASLDDLFSLDLISEGTSGVTEALEQVTDDAAALKDNAGAATADDIDTLETAIDDAENAVSDLTGSLSADNASSVGSAIEDVTGAATSVLDTLTDCP